MKTAFITIQAVALAALLVLEISAPRTAGPSCATGAFEIVIAAIVGASAFFVLGFVKRTWMRIIAFLLVFLEAAAFLYVPNELRRIRLETLELSDPARSVADARELIRTRRERDLARTVALKDLPPSLRIPQVYRAQVHGDHLDLITDSHPDGHRGFRIWSADAKRPRKERPTKYPDISVYIWHNDFEVAPDNLP